MSCGLGAIKEMVSSGANDAEKDARAQLDFMEEIARLKMEKFYRDISNNHADPQLIPISKVVNKYEYLACTYETADKIGDLLTSAVSDFSKGPIADGIAKIASKAIGGLLGSASAVAKTDTRYAITVDPLGGISRLDAWFFVQGVSASAMTQKKANIVASVVVVSSADITQIDSNTLKVIINKCFSEGGLPPLLLSAMYAQIAPSILASQGAQSTIEPATTEQKEALAKWYQDHQQSPP